MYIEVPIWIVDERNTNLIRIRRRITYTQVTRDLWRLKKVKSAAAFSGEAENKGTKPIYKYVYIYYIHPFFTLIYYTCSAVVALDAPSPLRRR